MLRGRLVFLRVVPAQRLLVVGISNNRRARPRLFTLKEQRRLVNDQHLAPVVAKELAKTVNVFFIFAAVADRDLSNHIDAHMGFLVNLQCQHLFGHPRHHDHGVSSSGKVLVRKQLKRAELAKVFATLPPCLVGMEARS